MSLQSRLSDLIASIGSDIKALQLSSWQPIGGVLWVPGRYYGPNMFGSSTTGAVAASRLYLTPFRFPKSRNVDRLSFNVTVAGAAGTVARAGIWNSDSDGFPTTVAYDPGASLSVASSGLKEHVLAQAFTGLKWLGFVSSGVPTLTAFNSTMIPILVGATSIGGGPVGVSLDGVNAANALPSMVGQTLVYGSTPTPPSVMVRSA